MTAPTFARRTVLAVALAAGATAQAEPDPGRAVVRGLASADAREVAWAACAARDANDPQLARPLLDALVRWRADTTPHGRTLCLHLLDALLTVAAPVPGDVAAPLLDDDTCGVAAFALLARAPAHNEAVLLATFRRDLAALAPREPLSPRLVATGGLLAAQRTPGIAALIAGRVDRDLRVVVHDTGRGRRPRLELHDPPARPSAGWPPVPAFRFANASQRILGDWEPVVLPAAARGTVQRRASGRGAGLRATATAVPPTAPQGTALAWLCTIAGLPAPASEHELEHEFADIPGFVDAATTARDRRRELLRRVRTELVDKDVLTPAQAQALDGPVGVEVLDERADRSVALPPIPPIR